MTGSAPLASIEVRWFLNGVDACGQLKRWFEAAGHDHERGPACPPSWAERTDVYLVVPGADDMGIKWREGQLQVKGRVASLGTQVFSGRHSGHVERWAKWSYAGLPEPYAALFEANRGSGVVTVPVRKRRALRRIGFDASTGEGSEAPADAHLDRELGFEFTELEVGGRTYCSIAFEAYPDDAALRAAFAGVVSRSPGRAESDTTIGHRVALLSGLAEVAGPQSVKSTREKSALDTVSRSPHTLPH